MVTDFCVGDQIYKFRLIRKLGAGSFGEVWLVHDDTINNEVALKIIKPNGPLTINQFKEAQIGNRFNHGNLIKVHYADVVTDPIRGTFIVIAMDYLKRGSILADLNSRGFMPLANAIHVMRNVLFGLDHLHRLNFYHNDIKPGNILIGGAGQAVLSDYGIARRTDDVSGMECYKLHMAPEVHAGGLASVSTDIFQCGMTAFRLFCGDGCLNEKWLALGEENYANAIANGRLITGRSFPDIIPTKVRRIILKAIAVNPADRYQSAIQMLKDFERLSYPGYWTADENNLLIGERNNSDNVYRYDEITIGGGLFNFEAKVQYPSGRINSISRFSRTKIHGATLEKARRAYYKWVVEGK